LPRVWPWGAFGKRGGHRHSIKLAKLITVPDAHRLPLMIFVKLSKVGDPYPFFFAPGGVMPEPSGFFTDPCRIRPKTALANFASRWVRPPFRASTNQAAAISRLSAGGVAGAKELAMARCHNLRARGLFPPSPYLDFDRVKNRRDTPGRVTARPDAQALLAAPFATTPRRHA